MTTSIAASERWQWVIPPPTASTELGPLFVTPSEGTIRRHLRTLAVLVGDALILLVVVWLFAAMVLVIGTPIALLARLVTELIKLL